MKQFSKVHGIGRTFHFKENAEQLLKDQRPAVEKPVPFKKKILGIFLESF
ncbi:hypothetical protein RCO48_16585 [Peribacillus frigoritolerans]|nr:hypothetical protein [Peribacillus frigoritolerans]